VALLRRNHRDLLVWKESVALAVLVYRVTESFPRSKIFGLTSQIRRAASSVPANIAEGAGRTGTPELLRFLSIASGSLSELDTHIEIAHQLGYIKKRDEIDSKAN
jgi:four helix bundle protein